MSWIDDILEGAGEFMKGASYGAIIQRWSEKEGNQALNDIEEFVNQSTDEMVDQMDTILLQQAVLAIVPEMRSQLIKFYAFFKLCEYNKYRKWRGFPN